jgi:dihydrofolate reductase
MPKTQYFCAATLDGYIADSEDGLAWLMGYEGNGGPPDAEPMEGVIDSFLEGIGALVMGSSTYEFILDHGGWAYGDRPTWVLTSRELPAIEGADLRFHDGAVEEIHDQILEAAGDRDVWIVGGGPVASQFAEQGLLDELLVTIVPVALSDGKALFERPVAEPMTLLGTRAFSNGMVELRYALSKQPGK